MDNKNVSIIGHSFVTHLQRFLDKNPSFDRNFRVQGVSTSLIGSGGLKTGQLRSLKEKIIESKPHVVVLVLGDNEVGNKDPIDVCHDLLTAAALIKEWTGAKIIQLGVFPRFWNNEHPYFRDNYNVQAIQLNQYLRDNIDVEAGIYFWVCTKLAITVHNVIKYFDMSHPITGGVHFNDSGNCVFYNEIRRALIVLLKI